MNHKIGFHANKAEADGFHRETIEYDPEWLSLIVSSNFSFKIFLVHAHYIFPKFYVENSKPKLHIISIFSIFFFSIIYSDFIISNRLDQSMNFKKFNHALKFQFQSLRIRA